MAITISQQPDSLSLSGNLKDVILTSVAGQVPLQLSVLDTSGSSSSYKPILSHVYFPDNGNRIVINLSRVVQDQLSFSLSSGTSAWQQTLLARSFRLNIDDLSPVYFTVVRAGIDNLQETVSNWLSANFLTWQPTVKHVTYSTPEFLTYYAQQSCRVRVKIYYPDGTTPTTHTLATLTSEAWTIPVSYAVIASLLGLSTPQQLSAAQHLPGAYDVWIETTGGTRLTYVQRYVASSMRENEQWVLFENSLGGVDSFRAYGQGTVQAEHQHQQAEQDNDTAEYRVDTVRIQRRSTGWMDKAQRRWMLDFFPASRRWICQDGVFRPIIMTDDSVSYTLDNMPAEFEFTFRYTSNRPYLNLSRQLTLPSVLNITAPDLQSFTVPPRLVEFPRIGPTEGALIPVQSTYGEHWSVLSLESLIDYINQEIGLNGHIHSNKVDLDRISTDADGYLWLSSSQPGSETTLSKVKAGDSDHWSGHLFSDWLDQPVRHNDNVNFASVTATGDIVSTGGGVAAMGIADLSMSFGGGGTYVLPIASASTLGGIKVGNGLTIDSDGTLHAQGGGSVTSVVGQTGVVTVSHIASALTDAGYKLTDTVYELTKSKVENVLTGNISTHTHSQYLTGITSTMVTAALGYTPFNAGSCGSHDQPVYFVNGTATVIDALTVTGDIVSTGGGVAAMGIADLSMSFGGGTYVLPIASASTLGGIKVGSGLTIDADGTLHAQGGGSVTSVVGRTGAVTVSHIASALTDAGYKLTDTVYELTKSKVEAVLTGNISTHTHSQYLTGITGSMVTTALGYTPFNASNFTKAGIQSTLGISDWALAAQKPSYSYGDGFLTGFGTLATKSSLSSSDIPTLQISKISGLQNALDSKQSYIGSCGSHDQPVYFVNGTATVIDALTVPGDIVSTGGGVAAMGIADLSMSFGGGTYELPIASASTLGGIKVGSGLTIDADGTLHAQGGGNVTSVVGRTGAVTVSHIASALTDAGYKLTDTVYELTKTKVEAVLTGNISSHTHSQYLTAESDPIFAASPAKNITTEQISAWNDKMDKSGSNADTSAIRQLIIKATDSGSSFGSGEYIVSVGSSTGQWRYTLGNLKTWVLNGNAATATKLKSVRSIWGNSFDGSADITGNPVLPNNGVIYIKNSSGTERSVLTYNTNNILAIGYGTSYRDGSRTELWGNGIDFNSQTSQDLGRIDPSGNLSMNGGVSAKGIVDLANNTPAASGAEWEELQGSIGTHAKAAIIAGLSSDGDNGSHLTYHKFGNIVTLNGYVSFNDDTSTTAETYSTDGAISSGFRPAVNVEQYLSFRDSTSTQECYAFISIKTDGRISVRIYGSNNSQVSRYNPKIYLSGLTYYSAI